MRIDHLIVGAHHLPYLVSDVADLFRVGPDDAKLNRKADRRPEIEPVDAHARFR